MSLVKTKKKHKFVVGEELNPEQQIIFRALKDWRKSKAAELDVPLTVVGEIVGGEGVSVIDRDGAALREAHACCLQSHVRSVGLAADGPHHLIRFELHRVGQRDEFASALERAEFADG